MKEIKPTGWLISDGVSLQFTTKTQDLVIAKRFDWKITELYSEQSIKDIKANAVIEAANTLCIRGDSVKPVNYTMLVNHANKLRSDP